jgi:hypothetical protein
VHDLGDTIDACFAMWNEADPRKRAELIERAWNRDGRDVDPLNAVEGRAALGAMVAGVQTRFPGQVIRRTSAIDAHHDQFRFGWELAAPDGRVTVAGIDVGEVGPDGRLRRITGFFGAAPAPA